GLEEAQRQARHLHHGLGVGHVRGRTDPASPQAHDRRRQAHDRDHRLPGRGDAGEAPGRSRSGGEDLRRAVRSAREGRGAERIQRPRGSRRARGPSGRVRRAEGHRDRARRPRAGRGLEGRPSVAGARPHPHRGTYLGARVTREERRGRSLGFRVGDRVLHKEFGEGLIVEVRDRDGFEVLEIAFPDGIRRLTSLYPLEPARGAGRATSAPAVSAATSAPALRLGTDLPARGQFRIAPGADELFQRLVSGPYDAALDHEIRLRVEKYTLHRGFDRLLCLDRLHDVQKYDHQSAACMTVLRRLRGRALLADEVGLGKTIEAGIILKEYLLRGLVQRALVLVPASLVEQWDQELRRKFDLEFAVLKHGTAWWEEPLLLASMDTAKLLRHRDKVAAASFDLVVVDEAHRLKNQKTLAWKFLDRLAPRYILLLTATPVQNDLHELYNLVQLLRPGLLGTYRTFGREFMRRGDRRMPQNTGRLATLLGETMIRTTRASTSIRFPKREVTNVHFDLSLPEREIYDDVTRLVRRLIQGQKEHKRGAIKLTLLTLQKEIGSSSFAAIPTLGKLLARESPGPARAELEDLLVRARAVDTNAKFEGVTRLLSSSRDKVVIFTQFRATLEFLARSIRALGIRTAVFHGALTLREKEAAIAQFRDRARV